MPKISQLPSDTSPAGTDYLSGVQASGLATKSFTLNALLTWLFNNIPNAVVKGANIVSYLIKRSNNGTNITESAALIQTGWGAVVLGGTQSVVTANITFPVPFTNTPIINVTPAGDQASGAVALGNGGNNVQGYIGAKHHTDTPTGTVAYLWAPTGSWAAGNIVYYTWTAIGN